MSRDQLPAKRPLGNSGIEVRPLCFGGNVFGWTIDEKRSFEILDAFVDAGFDFIDTADVYSIWAPGHTGGESETVIGKWLNKTGKRDRIVLATKVGMQMGPDKKGLKPDYVFRAVEDSLRRLQTDRIDLYQSHADDDTVAIEETLRTYESFIKAGKVRVIGVLGTKRQAAMPQVPTFDELGLKGFEDLPYYGFYAPAGTSQKFITQFSVALAKVVAEPEVRHHLTAMGLTVGFMTPQQLATREHAYTEAWRRIIKTSGFVPQ